MDSWDADQYLAFADERSLPFHHLVAAVAHLRPRRVLDIGCGPGALTATLLARWPRASIHGIDSSPAMIELARRREVPGRLSFELADVRTWSDEKEFDLMLSNACFQWIDDHPGLFDRLTPRLTDGGTLAFQVPANHDQPSHTVLDELCAAEPWRSTLAGIRRTTVETPEWYLDELERRGFNVIAWQTTFFHRLQGDDPVLEWVKGTTLRPALERLDREQTDAFLHAYGNRLREAYPAREELTVFPFIRTFVVATRLP
jgi:trans-aconitate 2-methyltransferase